MDPLSNRFQNPGKQVIMYNYNNYVMRVYTRLERQLMQLYAAKNAQRILFKPKSISLVNYITVLCLNTGYVMS